MTDGSPHELEPYPTDHGLGIEQAQEIGAAVDALFSAGCDADDVTMLRARSQR